MALINTRKLFVIFPGYSELMFSVCGSMTMSNLVIEQLLIHFVYVHSVTISLFDSRLPQWAETQHPHPATSASWH